MKEGNFIILKTMAFKEADLIVHALGRGGGKHHFLARSALKSKKRFGGGVLEPMNFVHLSYDTSKQKSEFVPISEGRLLDGFEGIRKDYDRLQVGLSLVKDMFHLAVEGSEESGDLYNLLGNALKKLETTSEIHILQTQFRIKLLFYGGFLQNEEGEFNAFLKEPIQNCELLKPYFVPRLKSMSDLLLKELGVY
jgi:DNA repair protein RecO (recombination protein O)